MPVFIDSFDIKLFSQVCKFKNVQYLYVNAHARINAAWILKHWKAYSYLENLRKSMC